MTGELSLENSLRAVPQPGGVSALLTCFAPDSRLLCAGYSPQGQLLSLESRPLPGDGVPREYGFFLKDTVVEARIFLLSAQWSPLCPGAAAEPGKP